MLKQQTSQTLLSNSGSTEISRKGSWRKNRFKKSGKSRQKTFSSMSTGTNTKKSKGKKLIRSLSMLSSSKKLLRRKSKSSVLERLPPISTSTNHITPQSETLEPTGSVAGTKVVPASYGDITETDCPTTPWLDLLMAKEEPLKAVKGEIKFKFRVTPKENQLDDTEPAFPGCSMEQISDPFLCCTDKFTKATSPEIGEQSFASSDPRTVKVRKGPNYKKYRKKEASGTPIYDLVSADCFQSSRKLYNFSDYIEFPNTDDSSPMPEFLVINIMNPNYKPVNPLFHHKKTDGEGINLVQIFKLSDWARKHEDDPSVQLFRRFMKISDEFSRTKNPRLRDTVNRLKQIIGVLNQKDLGFRMLENKLFPKYNKTPWLIRHFLTNYKLGPNCFEIDIDFHKLKYTTLQLGQMIISKVRRSVLDSSIIIEGRNDGEMPERILCHVRMFHLDFENSPVIDLNTLNEGSETKSISEYSTTGRPLVSSLEQKTGRSSIILEKGNLAQNLSESQKLILKLTGMALIPLLLLVLFYLVVSQ